MFFRILVGMDGSDRGASALAVATELAVAERGRLALMATVPHPSPWAWGGPISLEDLRRDSERDSETALRKAAEAVPAQVSTTVLVRHGPAVARLLDEVRRDDYDLIVVGSRHRGRLRSALFGGLGHKLERQSPVPVLVVPVPTPDVRGSERRCGRDLGLLRVNRLRGHGSAAACVPRSAANLYRASPWSPAGAAKPLPSEADTTTPADAVRRNDRTAWCRRGSARFPTSTAARDRARYERPRLIAHSPKSSGACARWRTISQLRRSAPSPGIRPRRHVAASDHREGLGGGDALCRASATIPARADRQARWHRLLHNGTARRPHRALRLQPGGMITTIPPHFPTRLSGLLLHRFEDLGRLLLDASVAIGSSRRAIEFHRMAALQRTPRFPWLAAESRS
jgi:nucleotide-binding universal stress UspA family protein